MKGRRLPDNTTGYGRAEHQFQPGDYSRHDPNQYEGETWWFMTPNEHYGRIAKHTVTVHEDETITVSPSIRVYNSHGELWHGYLERGVWRSC